jgi:predicted MFS family arabinose efflux permease
VHFQPSVWKATQFWSLVAMLILSFFAAAAPSPLYRAYQVEWRFSATTLTAIFAEYALVVLVTLLVFGSLSDHLGRRPVIVIALAVNASACELFLLAHGVGLLFAARALQGIAVGLATGALGATLIELQPKGSGLGSLVWTSAPNMGLALGALGTSALVQYGPAPTHLVWWLLLGGFIVGILLVLAIPDSTTGRSGTQALLRPRVNVPREARGTFAAALPCLAAVWALAGLYLSLGPSLAADLLGSQNPLWGGFVIFLLCGTAAVATPLFRAYTPRTTMLVGCLVLLVGVALTVVSIATTAALLLVGTAVAGVGFGPAFLGAFRTSIAPVAPGDRAGFIAAIGIVTYLAFSIPVLIAGVATSRFGLHETALVYSVSIAALVAATTGSFLLRTSVASGARES